MYRTVYIVFDYDPKEETREQVTEAANQLAEALSRTEAQQLKIGIIDLPPASDGGRQGVDDFLKVNGDEESRELLDEASESLGRRRKRRKGKKGKS
jgi:hypothetical protein